MYCIHPLLRPGGLLLGGILQQPVSPQLLKHGCGPATWLHHHEPTVMGVTGPVSDCKPDQGSVEDPENVPDDRVKPRNQLLSTFQQLLS